ncbi:DUF1800 domain-containing protein [Flavobacteriaceae bacterium TP-CH-4]|uniref:DUF1800 domain-containing protein n=1 Tax=Pelagihabitans pacificus TaxID=2696054 RepID=A0A967E6J8_9FLAO|nr:DUF1800 domain-containing protein [Pelagihabitans pacificus]NHF60602.1 DUF1800 domain-containing protein [Pelagihabitans pacificus]
MEYFVNCNTATLAPYGTPLDRTKAAHLYRRLGFSASVQTIDQATGQNAGTLVDALVNQAIATAPLAAPAWANWTNANYPADDDQARQLRRAQISDWQLAYTNALLNNGLKDRLSFFWSNHFVTELAVYDCAAFLAEYTDCLQRNALGNFRTFVSEIGLTSAMLFYLDGAYNNGNRPNENYARELYELFTLGEGNRYDQTDIEETSKALTGYTDRGEVGCTKPAFNPERFNTDTKTIFGRTGNWGYDDVINILFEERADSIARFVCTKLYEFFVHPDSKREEYNPGGTYPVGHPQGIINALADTFLANNFEIAPVLRQLFKSEHFFDDTTIGVIIKSPFDLYLNLIKETGFAYNDDMLSQILNNCNLLGQTLFSPVDVAGWQRDRTWINTNFIIGRWLTCEMLIEDFWNSNTEQFRTFGIAAAGPNGAITNDPDEVARAIIDTLTPKGLLTPVDYSAAIDKFRAAYEPDMVYQNGSWNMNLPLAPQQVKDLLIHMASEPEFQLK